MTFNQIPANASVFVDANILIYYFTPDPTYGPECQLLIERIYKSQDFVAYTSTHVLSEVAHQLMVMEAATVFGWPLAGITRRLRQHPRRFRNSPAFVRRSTRFLVLASKFFQWKGICRPWRLLLANFTGC
jgi:predicted nucleic acid-binding protein